MQRRAFSKQSASFCAHSFNWLSVAAAAIPAWVAVMVPVYAYGTGAEAFAGLMDNTDIPKKIAERLPE